MHTFQKHIIYLNFHLIIFFLEALDLISCDPGLILGLDDEIDLEFKLS